VLLPVKLIFVTRLSVAPALLAALAASTMVFVATPLVLTPLADKFGVTVGAVGLISTAQLGGFVLSSWFAGRFLRPLRPLFITMCVIGTAANVAAAFAPNLPTLCAAVFACGLSLGLAAWFGWQAAFGNAERVGDVAVIGPLVGALGSPLVALFVDRLGLRAMYLLLAALLALPLLFSRQIDATADGPRRSTRRHPSTRAARAILIALGLITLSGSAVFVFAASIGQQRNGLSPFVVSLVYGANALAGIPTARWKGRRGPSGGWYLIISIFAFLVPAVSPTPVYVLAIIAWGACFFMGLPAAFSLLASRSNYPQERAGDAQAIMALGRVFGPLIGGAIVANEELVALGVVAGGTMALASIVLLYVERERFAVRRSAQHFTPE
jgi:predicted MFS family arabinose efflux permease